YFPEPDRRRRQRLGEIKRQPPLRQLAADEVRSEDRCQTDREAGRKHDRRHRDGVASLRWMNARQKRHDQRQGSEGDGGQKDKAFLGQFPSGDDHCLFHDCAPWPVTAMKISSSDMAETSALVVRRRSKATSS